MIRIVGIERNPDAQSEFILLQNQGHMRAHLRGHAIIADKCLSDDCAVPAVHFFTEDEYVQPGCFVLLKTGHCDAKWTRTKDGGLLYQATMGRSRSVWDKVSGTIHVLNVQHSYCERQAVTV